MTIDVTAVNDDPTGAPVITGPARVGHTLSASRTGIGDVDGLPANESDYAYQWVQVDGGVDTDITGATTSTYEVVTADDGKKLKVEVSYTDGDGTPETVPSAETATVAANTAPVATNSRGDDGRGHGVHVCKADGLRVHRWMTGTCCRSVDRDDGSRGGESDAELGER